jgi:hypothetical protein
MEGITIGKICDWNATIKPMFAIGSDAMAHALLQSNSLSTAALSKVSGINARTVTKFRKCNFVGILEIGPTKRLSSELHEAEKAMIVVFGGIRYFRSTTTYMTSNLHFLVESG